MGKKYPGNYSREPVRYILKLLAFSFKKIGNFISCYRGKRRLARVKTKINFNIKLSLS